MNETSTISLEDLISFAYNETKLLTTVLVNQAIESDEFIEDLYASILSARNYLDKISVDPAPKTIHSILSYSQEV